MMEKIPWKLSLDYAYRSWMHSQQDFYNSELARRVLYANNPNIELGATKRAAEALKAKALKNTDNLKVANAVLKSIEKPPYVNIKEATKKYSQRQLTDLLGMSKWTIAKCFEAKEILGVPIKVTRKGNIKAILTDNQLRKIKHLIKTRIANDKFITALKRGKEIVVIRNKDVKENLLRFEILILYGNLFGRQNDNALTWDIFFDDSWNQGALFYLKNFPLPFEEYEGFDKKIKNNKHEWAQLHEKHWRDRLAHYLDTQNNRVKHEKGQDAKAHMNRLCVFFDKMFSGIHNNPQGIGNIEISNPKELTFIISTYYNQAISKIDLLLDSYPAATGPDATGAISDKIKDLMFDLYTDLGQRALDLDGEQFSTILINNFEDIINLIPDSTSMIDSQLQLKDMINASRDIDDAFKDEFLTDAEDAIYKSNLETDTVSYETDIAEQLNTLMHSYPIETFSITSVLANDAFSELHPKDDIRFVDQLDLDKLKLLKYILIVTAFANAVPENVEKLSYMSGKKYTVRKTRVDLLSHKNLSYLLGVSETKVRKLMIYGNQITDMVKIWNRCKTMIRSD